MQGLNLFSTVLQVFIHNPHSTSLRGGRAITSHDSDISILNINQQVSAVAAGQLNTSGRDTLLVGTPTNILAYDVENNSDLFYKDVSAIVTANRNFACHRCAGMLPHTVIFTLR